MLVSEESLHTFQFQNNKGHAEPKCIWVTIIIKITRKVRVAWEPCSLPSSTKASASQARER